MPVFGKRSYRNLETCHKDIQDVLKTAIKYKDFSVLEGHRSEHDQNYYYKLGRSKVKYPNSKHNSNPSLAVDVAPYPIDWKDRDRFVALVYFIQGIAMARGIKIRLGADWNDDLRFTEKFQDLPHLELHSKLIDGEWVRY